MSYPNLANTTPQKTPPPVTGKIDPLRGTPANTRTLHRRTSWQTSTDNVLELLGIRKLEDAPELKAAIDSLQTRFDEEGEAGVGDGFTTEAGDKPESLTPQEDCLLVTVATDFTTLRDVQSAAEPDTEALAEAYRHLAKAMTKLNEQLNQQLPEADGDVALETLRKLKPLFQHVNRQRVMIEHHIYAQHLLGEKETAASQTAYWACYALRQTYNTWRDKTRACLMDKSGKTHFGLAMKDPQYAIWILGTRDVRTPLLAHCKANLNCYKKLTEKYRDNLAVLMAISRLPYPSFWAFRHHSQAPETLTTVYRGRLRGSKILQQFVLNEKLSLDIRYANALSLLRNPGKLPRRLSAEEMKGLLDLAKDNNVLLAEVVNATAKRPQDHHLLLAHFLRNTRHTLALQTLCEREDPSFQSFFEHLHHDKLSNPDLLTIMALDFTEATNRAMQRIFNPPLWQRILFFVATPITWCFGWQPDRRQTFSDADLAKIYNQLPHLKPEGYRPPLVLSATLLPSPPTPMADDGDKTGVPTPVAERTHQPV